MKSSYPNINIEIQDDKGNHAHNIDTLLITNIRFKEINEDEDEDDEISETESLSELENDDSDDEDTEN